MNLPNKITMARIFLAIGLLILLIFMWTIFSKLYNLWKDYNELKILNWWWSILGCFYY